MFHFTQKYSSSTVKPVSLQSNFRKFLPVVDQKCLKRSQWRLIFVTLRCLWKLRKFAVKTCCFTVAIRSGKRQRKRTAKRKIFPGPISWSTRRGRKEVCGNELQKKVEAAKSCIHQTKLHPSMTSRPLTRPNHHVSQHTWRQDSLCR